MISDGMIGHHRIAVADISSSTTFEFDLTGGSTTTSSIMNDTSQTSLGGVEYLDVGSLVGQGDSLSSIANATNKFNFLDVGSSLNDQDTIAFLDGFDSGDAGYCPKLPLLPQLFYPNVKHFTTTITAGGDQADVYFPELKSQCHTTELPIALMLQGALVDKSEYSNFASQVASYGFVVVVPNNERTITAPNGQSFTGLFAEQGQVHEVLAQMRVEDNNPASPIFKIVDTDKLGLLGHSFGGGAGLGATQEEFCLPGICSGDYTRPPELKAGIFYGTNFRNQQTQEFLSINNDDIPIGLIAGSLDSVAPLSTSQATYDQILNPPKALITVTGANHYGITNEDNLTREPNRPTLDQATATETIARWSGLFLKASMLGDQRVFDYLFNFGDLLDPNVDVMSQTQSSILNVA